MLIVLRPDWPGTFRRTVRHDEADPGILYVFSPGEPVTVAVADVPGLADDLNKALFLVVPGTTKPDFKATAAAVADLDAFEASLVDDIDVDLLGQVELAAADDGEGDPPVDPTERGHTAADELQAALNSVEEAALPADPANADTADASPADEQETASSRRGRRRR